MESVISQLFLLGGADLQLTPAVTVKHPIISDILAINNGLLCEDYYWSYVSSILSDPYDHMVYLDDKRMDYEQVTPLTVFALRWGDAKEEQLLRPGNSFSFELLKNALSFYFGQRNFDVIVLDGKPIIIDVDDPQWFINDALFEVLSDFITKMNCLERTDKIRPATKSAKRILIEDMRSEQKKRLRSKTKPQHVNYIGDALATVLSGGSGAITLSNYTSAHIYQLMAASKAVQRQMIVQSMLNGIYTGMLKADKLSDNDLRWV